MATLKSKLLSHVDSLLEEGKRVLTTTRQVYNLTLVDTEGIARWRAGCLNLIRLLGGCAEQWRGVFEGDEAFGHVASRMQGTLSGIKAGIESDLLVTVEDMVFAEAFDDLLEQADHLLSQGYLLAAGVLGRAVLEEHLRQWSSRSGCAPAKPRPTLADFNGELYKASQMNKLEMKHVEAMAAIGNDAAHNASSLKREDVERQLRDTREFLVRHPLA